MKRDHIIGIILAVLGVVMFSAKAVMVKMAYEFEVDAISLLLLRMSFALPIYFLIAMAKKPKVEIKKVDWLWLVAFGILGYYLASLFDFMGLQYIKAGLERIILFVYPTIVVILSIVFVNEKISQRQLLAIVLTYIGIFIAFWPELSLENEGLFLGVSLIFLSAFTYASYITGSGWLIPKFGSTVFTSYVMMVACVFVIIHYAWIGDYNLLNYPSEVYWLAFAMAIVSTVIPSYLVSFAIKKLGAAQFAIVASFGPISTILLAAYFLGEEMYVMQWIGTVVVILGVFIVSKKS